MSSPYAQPAGKTLNPTQPIQPKVTPQPSTSRALSQSQGGNLPKQVTETQQPTYAPTGPSPYEAPLKQAMPQPKPQTNNIAKTLGDATRRDIVGLTVPKPKITPEKAETAGMIASYGLGPEVGVPVTAIATGGFAMVGIQAGLNRVIGNPGVASRRNFLGLNINTSKALTPQSAYQSFALGSIFTGAASVALKGAALATGGAESIFAGRGIQSVLARSAFAGGFGSGVGYIFTRNPVTALELGVVSAGMAGAADFLGGGAKTELTKPATTVTAPREEADLTQITGGKSTGLLTEQYGDNGDIRETSRQTELTTKTTTIKDQNYINWLKDFNANFRAQQIELEGQGTRNYITGDIMETVRGASGMRAQADPFLSSLEGTTTIERAGDLGKELTVVARGGKVSETLTEEGNFLSPEERETFNMLKASNKVILQNDIYNSGRVQGEMTPETAARLTKALPNEDNTPYFGQRGGLSYQQLVNLKTVNPNLEEIPIYTDILKADIREIPGSVVRTEGTNIASLNPTFLGIKIKPSLAVAQAQRITTNQAVKQAQMVDTTTMLDVPTKQTTTVPNRTKVTPTTTETTSDFFNVGEASAFNYPFLPSGQFPERGGSIGDYPNFTGKYSVKRKYPIAVPEEFFSFG